jgi:uncharacterized protein
MEPDEAWGKYLALLAILKRFKHVAVAYSGGVDSTLLAYAASEALGSDRVLILHASSVLLAKSTIIAAEKLIADQFDNQSRFKIIHLDPLQDNDFIQNSKKRCYICKKLIYNRLISEMKKEGIGVLLDGTNCDDLLEDRPGLQAVQELGVETPLVDVGFRKQDIRTVSARLHLANADLPSNSCLATRLECDTLIEEHLLVIIDTLEIFLVNLGFTGSRVRPRDKMAIIELRESDFRRISEIHVRTQIKTYFRDNGYPTVVLNISGRQ